MMSEATATTTRPRNRFFEGGNGVALVAIPLALVLCAVFYHKVAAIIGGLGIKIEDIYSYVFNLFAIEFGGLLALFALFVCRPTPFLERIKNTNVFESIVVTTRITMTVATVVIAVTFVFGIIHLAPNDTLSLQSILFLIWTGLALIATLFYATTVRLIFTALM
jgi:hypothetical protein